MHSVRRLVLLAILAGMFLIPESVSATTSIRGVVPGEVDARVLSAPTPGAVAVRGTLKSDSGKRTRGRVAALVWPNEAFLRTVAVGDRVETPTVGWSATNADGSFALSIDRRLLVPRYVGRDGIVNLTVVGWNASHQGEWHTSAYVATDRRPGPTAPGPAKTRPIAIRTNSPIHAISRTRLTASAGAVSPNIVICYNVLRSTYDADTVIGESWPWGPHTGYMVIDANHTVKLGVATSASGAIGSWKASGSSTESTSIGSDFNGPSAAFRDYRLEMRYGKYQNTCVAGFTETPMYETGGMWYSALSSRDFPTGWNQCARTSGNWWRASTSGFSYSLGGGVKFASVLGIDLSVETNYATTRKINYYYNGIYHVCGNNDVPSRASRLRTGP